MTLLSLFKNSNNQNPQTLLLGEDSILNDYLARSFIHEKRFAGLDKVTIDCTVDGIEELIANLSESSLFSQQKMIIVKNPFFLTAKSPKKLQKQLVRLQDIFTKMNQLDDLVIIIASYSKIDRRKKLTKTVLKQFNVIETNVKSYEIGTIIKNLIKAEGYQISSAGLQLLLERSDQVLDTVLENYNKLKMLAVDGRITDEVVAQNVDLSFAQNVFAILETALEHNYQEAIERLENQLREGTSPIQVLAVFENQLELILVVKLLKKRGRNENQIVKELGIHPYRVKLALQYQLAVEKVADLLKLAIELDFKYKSGQYQKSTFLKLFILDI
ncbi:DNA polymerase III subunit delta [Lactobacillus sp. ESL0684]|uniref:DNA polymerase III subunit delta n=1 Tax=Lactobacillus sp. ESL0684 TaxID=2983213 RepID=UPI0023F9C741|nr:DNA polymerase III subunit delta [Lactobacillus sp. ESL0684]WEV42864.1 DNA polymerase III subunit delta [Lactobacillus sp. ESL0684]